MMMMMMMMMMTTYMCCCRSWSQHACLHSVEWMGWMQRVRQS